MFTKNVYKEARSISEVIGIFALIGIVGGLAYEWFVVNITDVGYVVAFSSALILLVAYICTMVSHVGENIASLTQAEDAKPTARESFERLLRNVKHTDKTDKS
jgi:hypothetical protein